MTIDFPTISWPKVCGVLAGACGVISATYLDSPAIIFALPVYKFFAMAASVLGGIGLSSARQNNHSDEQAGAGVQTLPPLTPEQIAAFKKQFTEKQ